MKAQLISVPPTGAPQTWSRRERQREQTRRDLAVAAFELASEGGLAQVRVPEIAARAGVSTRTFNNYFTSKEQAIAWLSGEHLSSMAALLRDRPPSEPLADALIAAVTGVYTEPGGQGLAEDFLPGFRALVAGEPALYGEYLLACQTAEQALAQAIKERLPAGPDRTLEAAVIAGMTLSAERAAVRTWARQPTRDVPLAGTLQSALRIALRGLP
jgi:AcrR family transcriptional regulator